MGLPSQGSNRIRPDLLADKGRASTKPHKVGLSPHCAACVWVGFGGPRVCIAGVASAMPAHLLHAGAKIHPSSITPCAPHRLATTAQTERVDKGRRKPRAELLRA